MADGGTHPKREDRVQGDWGGGCHLEGRGGDTTSPTHDIDNISRCGRTWRGGRHRKQKAGQADQVGRNGAEQVQMNGKYGKLVNILHKDRV